MTQLIINGSDKKINQLKSMAVKLGLDYKIVAKKKRQATRRHRKLVSDIKAALKEVELAEKGKIKLKSFDEFLNEL